MNDYDPAKQLMGMIKHQLPGEYTRAQKLYKDATDRERQMVVGQSYTILVQGLNDTFGTDIKATNFTTGRTAETIRDDIIEQLELFLVKRNQDD